MRRAGMVPGLALLLLASSATPAAGADRRPVVAVFDLEDTREKKVRLSPQKLRSLTDYLASRLAIGGKFKIVPRASIREAIQAKKKESYKECYDEACQIEIGKEIAAQESLATKIDELGGECLVTSTLFDLRQGATENSASYRGPCGQGELLTAIEQIAARLRGDEGGGAANKEIRFDTSALPAVPSLELPPESGAVASGVDFGDLDVDAMELYDAAVQGEKDEAVPVEKKIDRWEEVKAKAPRYRVHASGRIVAWREHARKKRQIEAIQKQRAAKMLADWAKLARLLKLKMISAEDKAAWGEAFYSAYAAESRDNPFAREPAAVEFMAALTEKKQRAEARLQAESVRASIAWVFSRTAGIELTKTEITVAQYRACVQAGKCSQPKSKSEGKYCNWGHPDRDAHPINCVDWNQATAFCEWAGGRLPTEQEWEAEASAGGKREYPWGDQAPSCERAIWSQGGGGCGRDSTWPVCSKPAGNSAGGLCDMAGNVWEWTSSLSLYENTGTARVLRGGSWGDGGTVPLRASSRVRVVPAPRSDNIGLRCGRVSR